MRVQKLDMAVFHVLDLKNPHCALASRKSVWLWSANALCSRMMQRTILCNENCSDIATLIYTVSMQYKQPLCHASLSLQFGMQQDKIGSSYERISCGF